ncbi:hypothetical protein ANN_18869 [Periplaneta americana]|uniref:Mariner Mos1 transposase n=1 Tax=Periplaneta americana TaxID=6978 RepID=A0ABQ8SPY6_PERAM|nr:hypothetical protein ANN_18869 [Periplaneta americana]
MTVTVTLREVTVTMTEMTVTVTLTKMPVTVKLMKVTVTVILTEVTVTKKTGTVTEMTGLMHHEFIPEGRTVTKELYVETLRRLWDAVRRKRPEKWVENNWFLMHDNAPAHRAIIVKNFLARHNITALDHSPYSPDLSPPDYFLFPRLKSHLKGRRFNAEEVIANATRALRRVSQNGFQACFQELYTRWQKCVVAEGNYFEGNAVE